MKKTCLIILGLSLILAGTKLTAQQRNVLFIAVDDLKPLIGAYGDKVAITPNLDKLMARGVSFTNAHCQQAVCGPSRASLLTGLYPDVTEVWDLHTQMRSRNPKIVTLPQYFRENGYETVGMGKIFDGGSVDEAQDKRSWSVPYIYPEANDPVYGEPAGNYYQLPANKDILLPLQDEAKKLGLKGKEYRLYIKKHMPSTEMLDISDEGYFDGAMAGAAANMLDDLAKKDKPFFFCVGFIRPHLPFVAPKKYWDLYDRNSLPLAAFQQQAAQTIDLSYHDSPELRAYTDIPDAFQENGLLNEAKQRELIHGYYACVSYIDAQIGRILDALDQNGLKDNTSIVLWGDHGWHLGDHGLWNKHSNFEQATRVPLIFADSRYQSGVQNGSPVEFIDIFPTLCDLTSLKVPTHLQGNSLLPLLSGKAKSVKEFAVSQYPRNGHMGYSLRNERYRFTAWMKDKNTQPNATILFMELYDYKKDPLEKVNIARENPVVTEEMKKQLLAFLVELNAEKKAIKKQFASEDKPNSVGNNLLKNPGFENGLTGWYKFGDNPVEISEEFPHDGKSGVKLTSNVTGIVQQVDLKPNTSYMLSAWVKTTPGEDVILKVKMEDDTEFKKLYKKGDLGQVTLTFETRQSASKVKILFMKYAPGQTGPAWADDFELIEIQPTGMIPLRKMLDENFQDDDFYFGATIAHKQLGTQAEGLLTENFNYTVPENEAKLTVVHPQPGVWNWEKIDQIVSMAQKNNLMVRLHGPISPQSSKWVLDDKRTPAELEDIMTEYMTAQCQHFNGHPSVKWMDVVNETVNRDGTWFGPKPGIDKWENPWTIIGADSDKNQTPLYISRAFEIANKYAPDIQLVFNQHGGMEEVMWEKVKETILYLKAKGFRVDGLGWQAHMNSEEDLPFDSHQLEYLSSLIQWTHAQNLTFHVTEIDYKIKGEVNTESLNRQADAYTNILKVLLNNRQGGRVTFNTWGLVDGNSQWTDQSRFIFNEQGEPKPVYHALGQVLASRSSQQILKTTDSLRKG